MAQGCTLSCEILARATLDANQPPRGLCMVMIIVKTNKGKRAREREREREREKAIERERERGCSVLSEFVDVLIRVIHILHRDVVDC